MDFPPPKFDLTLEHTKTQNAPPRVGPPKITQKQEIQKLQLLGYFHVFFITFSYVRVSSILGSVPDRRILNLRVT